MRARRLLQSIGNVFALDNESRSNRYGLAAVATLLAVTITWTVPLLRHYTPVMPLLGAVMFSAVYGGFGPALLSTALGMMLTNRFILLSRPSHFLPTAVADLVQLTVFLALALLISSLEYRSRRAEEDLRQREQHFRLLIENTSDVVTILNRDSIISYESPSVERVLGYTPAELVGHSVFEFVHPDDVSAAAAGLGKALTAPGVTTPPIEVRFLAKDGSWHTVETVGKNLLHESSVAGLVMHSRDIGERKALLREQAARMEAEAARRRFRDLVEGLDAIVWEADPKTGTFSFVSSRAEQMLGFPLQSWLSGTDWVQHIYPEDRKRVFEAITQPVKSASSDCEYRAITASGRLLWLRLIVYGAQDEAGDVRQLRGLIVDITERHQSEAALRLSERLAATGRLAASIAHEINNPMAAVTNLMYLLENCPGLDVTARQYARLAQEELRRMAHITRQMLGFYRDSEKPVSVDVTELLDNLFDLYHRKVQNSGARLDRRYEPVPSIDVFPGEMRQVFSNILLNALDAVGAGGLVIVHVFPSHDWRDPARQGVRVVFADNGPGIRPEIARRIFEPFFTTKGQKGTGLGLWVSQGIVNKHHGAIRVHTSRSPGRTGTAFSIFLPQGAATSAIGAGSAA